MTSEDKERQESEYRLTRLERYVSGSPVYTCEHFSAGVCPVNAVELDWLLRYTRGLLALTRPNPPGGKREPN